MNDHSPERSRVGTILEQDHREIDGHFETFANSLGAEPDAAALAAGANGLRHHIWVEEELHFPPLRAAGVLGPILVMLREHGTLWSLLEDIEAQLDAGEDPAATYGDFEALLQTHNTKEEHIVYPSGDELLSPEEADDVRHALTAEEMPTGWRPQMAP